MLAVTGGAGFIGANLIAALNKRGRSDILVVDEFGGGGDNGDDGKARNLADLAFAARMDKHAFLDAARADALPRELTSVLHQGACADTLQADESYMLANNFEYSKALFEFCRARGVQLIYASSASVYGGGKVFTEDAKNESALNVYAKSKLLFDQFVRAHPPQNFSCVGLRYFNVYGAREHHKGRMASVALHFFGQYRREKRVRLFAGGDGYADGEQLRDFVSVDDIAAVNLFFLDNPHISGIYNAGTGRSETFNAVALAVVNACRRRDNEPPRTLEQARAAGEITYIEMPPALRKQYQSYTEADIGKLRAAGFARAFCNVEQGVGAYVETLFQEAR